MSQGHWGKSERAKACQYRTVPTAGEKPVIREIPDSLKTHLSQKFSEPLKRKQVPIRPLPAPQGRSSNNRKQEALPGKSPSGLNCQCGKLTEKGEGTTLPPPGLFGLAQPLLGKGTKGRQHQREGATWQQGVIPGHSHSWVQCPGRCAPLHRPPPPLSPLAQLHFAPTHLSH